MRFLSSIAFGSILAAAAALSMPASATDMQELQNNPLDIGAYTDDADTTGLTIISGTLDIYDVFDTGGLAADSALEVAAVFDDQGGDDVIIGKIDALPAMIDLDGGVLVFKLDPMTLGDDVLAPKAPEVASLDAESVGDDTCGILAT